MARGVFCRHRRPLPACMLLVAAACPVAAWGAEDQTIVVTARRNLEKAVDVPLAVDVMPAADIGIGGVDGLHSLAARVPGLSYSAGWGGFFSTPALRGQNQPNPLASDNVGIFIDGVYQANRDAVDAGPLDLERIEVVRGPQSALFGHSSFAGLVHFIPALPTETLFLSVTADLGTDELRGIRGTVSGPLNALLKTRLAASWRAEEGTRTNAAAPGQHFDSSERFAAAASLATRDDSGPFSARIAARYGDSRSSQPEVFALDQRQYDCGGRDPASGIWSYFCGRAPIPGQVALSPGIPDSRTRSGQVAMHLAFGGQDVEVRSDTSFYRGQSDSFRDFDGAASGEIYGVCLSNVNCNGMGALTIPVARLRGVNTVERRSVTAREFVQELRLRSTGERRLNWQIGGSMFWTRTSAAFAYGAERGDLAVNERFSVLVLSNPLRVGTPAGINLAIVDDPDRRQIVQNQAVEHRRTFALFATADYRLFERLRLRGEARMTWERLRFDSRRANFGASFGTSLGAKSFRTVTPRISLDYRPGDGWLTYSSYARGARSGGFNAFPNLPREEQTFEPETNWTAEVGVKYFGSGLVRSVRLAAYDIDWDNTQIIGLSITPGVAGLIHNARGIHTQGVEIGVGLAPAPWLQFDFAYSYVYPRFKRGSEDPGGSAFCGLALGLTSSSFCTIRPSRNNPARLVADISGNVPARAVTKSWSAGLSLVPRQTMLPGLRLRADITHQGNVFDRQINGLYFGARTLLGARLSVPLGPCTLELWGTNLTDARYVRFATGRPPFFYPGIARPTDLILGEGRRIGLTLRYAR